MEHVMGIAPSQTIAEALVEGLQKEHGFRESAIKVLFTDQRWRGRLGFRLRYLGLGESTIEVVREAERLSGNQIVVSVVVRDRDEADKVAAYMKLLGADCAGIHDVF